MKIYRKAQGSQQFTMIQPNPTAPAAQNLILQVQNLQVAQQAVNSLSAIAVAVNELKAKAADVEELIGEAGLSSAIDQSVRNSMSSNSAMNFMIQMNLIPSIDNIFDNGYMSMLQTNIAKNITSAQQQQASMEGMGSDSDSVMYGATGTISSY